MTQQQKVLVTGGTGLVGSHLLYRLVTDGFRVRAIYRQAGQIEKCKTLFSFYHADEALFQSIEWVEGDVVDYFSVADALEGIDFVYHAAAFVTFDPKRKQEMLEINEEGTANVVNACLEKGIQKLCYVSSIATLGSPVNGNLIDEETSWQSDEAHSAYSLSKFRAEMQVWRGIKEGLNAVMVNPGVIIGPGELSRSSGALMARIKRGMFFYTLGSTGFVDVRDVVNAMVLLMQNDISDERFVLVAENLSFHQLIVKAATVFKSKAPRHQATPFLTGLAWRIDALASFLLRRSPGFTRENARTSHSKSAYSSKKFQERFQYQFISVDDSVRHVNRWFSTVNS
jgi:nucleoside-diphosphate-sugar epimerase